MDPTASVFIKFNSKKSRSITDFCMYHGIYLRFRDTNTLDKLVKDKNEI